MTLRSTRPSKGLMLAASLTLLTCTASWASTQAPCANIHTSMQARCKDMVQKKQTAQNATQHTIDQKYQAIADHYHAQVQAQQQMQNAAAQAAHQNASQPKAPASARPLPPSLSPQPTTPEPTATANDPAQTAPTSPKTAAPPSHAAPQTTTSPTHTTPAAATPEDTGAPAQATTSHQPTGETRFQINYH